MPSSNDDEDDVKIPALPSAADDYSTANNEEAAAAIVAASTTAAARPYVYQDYAQDDTDYGGDHDISTVVQDGRGLTNQKLPAKLAAMLSDPDLVTCITWMPHGRSWKILNRDLFSRYALPKYFGHTNHASFIRIVNAWGFRRVVNTGPDRDTYYHELFLRGKHNLHVKMKRLPTSHRKTPMDKNESSPNFYELSEKSPLPENVWLSQNSVASRGMVGGMTGGMVGVGGGVVGSSSSLGMMEGYHHHHPGMMGAAAGMGGGLVTSMNSRMQLMQQQHQQQQHMMGHSMSGMMPGMGMMAAAPPPQFTYPPVNPSAVVVGPGSSPSGVAAIRSSDNDTLTQLQRENDTLMRQLLQLQNQMNPPPNNINTNNQEDSSTNAAVIALQRDNERLIRQVMELQEQLPQELRMQIPTELLMPQQHQHHYHHQQQLQQSPHSRQQQGKSDG
ncbi:hypothetical protein ACHAXM_006742 [Skeletonema potamos]